MSRRFSGAATVSVAAVVAGLLTAGAVPASAAPDELSIEDAEVLDLAFDGSLSDTSDNAAAVTVQKGTAGYAEGVSGQAFRFNGSTALRLGTAGYLQPEDLTVSFWYNPSVAMGSAEQVFAWSKTVYNSDGWYLTSENGSTPLALSIGPSSGQPYKVAVEGSRADFFPAGQWTHVVATYDHDTKAVQFFRNGVRQTSVVKYAASASASGVLGSESTSVKTLGYNGPQYNGAHLNGLLDEYSLYSAVATDADVIALTRVGNPDFDPSAIAQQDIDALSIPATIAADFALPGSGAAGSTITWTTSNSDAIAIDGDIAHVTHSDAGAVTVRLTASASYGGSAPISRSFDVVIPQTGTSISLYLEDSGIENVRLDDDYLVNVNELTVDYLLELDSEKFLYSWYRQAGLEPTTPSGYGGWERDSGTRFQGHFFGHYMTALSQSYTTETDPERKQALLDELTEAIDGLDEVQDAIAAKDPANAGYVSPFPTSYLPSGRDGLLVPFYNLHKVLAGLLDAYQYGPPEVSEKALKIASGFGTWIKNYGASLSNPATILNTEYGGMNEALYELFSITKNPDHKRAAEYFDEVTLFQQLAAGQDVLNGKHANTTIPKLVGALKRYTVFTDNPDLYEMLTPAERTALPMYRTAAENFWQIVIDDHTYANGANSQSEHFHGAETLYEFANTGGTTGYGENSTAEGCNEYNMLKLSHGLFAVSKDVKYADYYESTFINSVLASQNPETGMMTYFQPQTAGYAKVFGQPLDQFWCDHGSAIESYTKLNDSIYFTDPKAIYVNQFRSSEFRSVDHRVTLVQRADVPRSDRVELEVHGLDGEPVREGTQLKLRVPSWVAGDPTLIVNGSAVDATADAGYITLEVADGDVIEYTIPAEVRVDDDTENPNWVAFKYGPVLLGTELSRSNVEASYTAGVLVQMGVADKSLTGNIVVDDAQAWKADALENIERIDDGENLNGMNTMRFKLHGVDEAAAALTFEPYYSLYNARYATYVTLVEPDSEAAQQLILQTKQQQRVTETTIDSLTSFDNNNSEADKSYEYSKSGVGVFNGQGFRDGQMASDAYFQYDMIVDPSLDVNYLGVRYYGGDNGRTFDVYLNDVLLKHERVTNAQGSTSWYIQYHEIPQAILDGIDAADSYKRNQAGEYVLDADGERIPVVTVRFQGNGSSYVGGVFGVYTSSSNAYATDAELSGLTAADGTVSPALAAGVHDYEIRVAEDAETVSIDFDPVVGSGLVYVDGVLIDDTVARTIPLDGDATEVTVRSLAQDHTTEVQYALTIVRAAAAPELDVTAVSTLRCVAGKAVHVVTVTNGSDEPVETVIESAYGTATVTLAPGKSVSKAFSSRLVSLDAGAATVTATAGEASVTVEAEYDAFTCK